jgi:hypothetical protein
MKPRFAMTTLARMWERLSSAKWQAKWPADGKVPEVSEAHFAAPTTGEAILPMLFRS